ncbi:MAG: hypothetical protein LUD19_06515 [Clostridia bacterium]|nr:hypothetical protein [Clostridia bacterium]
MATYKTTKNLLADKDVYNRYYGSFRGVDFSSDHTQVADSRLAYCVNMYRDYQSGQGQALETIAGFRRRVKLPEESTVFNVFDYSFKDSSGETVQRVIIHCGKNLYLWKNYPNSLDVEQTETYQVPDPSSTTNGVNTFEQELSENVASVVSVIASNGADIVEISYNESTHILTYSSSGITSDNSITVTYLEGSVSDDDILFSGMNEAKSTAFIINNRLYIIDGKNYLVYDGETVVSVLANAYVPTTYINIITSGVNADIGTEYEQRNILTPQFKHTFIADGETTTFYMNENELDSIDEVTVYGDVVTNYTTDLTNGTITFTTAPSAPEDAGYSEMYAGIEVTASKTYTSISGTSMSDEVKTLLNEGSISTITDEMDDISKIITGCTIAAIYDDRVFLSGNPDYPNHLFWCSRNSTGYVDPSYFGVLNCQQDGVGISPITGMIIVSDTLMVLKSDTQQEAMVYFHSASSTGIDLLPKLYPSSPGLGGLGCLGACVNFLDDPIFISRLGVEAMGQLSVRLERATEHRSSLIDAKLVNTDLSSAVVAEWNGYLLVLVDGNMYMADSRQIYTHDTGVNQYEWYYIEGVGIYKNQYLEYKYASSLPDELVGTTVKYCTACGKGANKCTCGTEDNFIDIPLLCADEVYDSLTSETSDLTGEVANAPDDDGNETTEVFEETVNAMIDGETYPCDVFFTVHTLYDKETEEVTGYEALYCKKEGNYTGGVFNKAAFVRSLDENIVFGTGNGNVCSFNFDKREDDGTIAARYYSFDGRTINCGCATKMDCCSIPHLTKKTIKKSTVIKTKTFTNSSAKVKVRTNRKPYKQITRISSSTFAFDNVDFEDFTFSTEDQSLFAVKEKEKKWVEKQYYIYSDEYQKPFALYYISYRYQVIGRYKN